MAQDNIRVSGIIRNIKGETISDAIVKDPGSKKYVLSNDSGSFSILIKAGTKELHIASLGYKPRFISVDSLANIVLQDSASSPLNDVIVIGYQSVSRKRNTASVATLSGKEIENLPAASFDQLLQGRVSGVNVQNYSGEPGGSPTVAVRGNSKIGTNYDQFNAVSAPLYVVDGVPQPTESYVSNDVGTGTNYLGGVNPNDIESIDILKDAAAAAIYGSRGANGVILIKTKKGTTGEPRINMDGYVGLTQRPELRDVDLGTAERRAKMALLAQSLTYNNQRNLPLMLTDSLNPAFNGNTDYQDMFYRTGLVTNTDLGMSGGSDNTTYRFNANYYDEQGIIKATGFKRYSMRLNLISKALKGKITFNPLIAYSRMDRDRGSGSSTNPISIDAGSMPSSLFNLSEDKKAYYTGTYNDNLDKNSNNQFTFNLNIGVNFNSFLKFTSQTAYLYNTSRRDWSRTNMLNSNSGNSSSSYADNETNVSTSNYLTFTKSLGRHNINLIAGQDVVYDTWQVTNASGYGGVSDAIQTVAGYSQDKIFGSSDYQSYGILSYYSRLAYDYNGKYLMSASFRTDGSSRFGKDSKWGMFPSFSLGWLISEEEFFKRWDNPISLLKVRASIGNSGSLPSSNYLQYNLYSVNAGGYNGNSSATSYNGVTSIIPNFSSSVAQPELSWERSTQMNLGLDAELWNGKYTMSIDLWNKDNKDQMFNINLPVTTGYSTALTNAIGVRNTGVDFTLAASPLSESGKVKWFSRLNISYSKGKIMYLPNGGRDLLVNAAYSQWYKTHILSVGAPVNAFYLYKTLGVFSKSSDIPVNPLTGDKLSVGTSPFQAGEFWLADLDGNYKIDPFVDGINPDKMPIGDPNPKFTGGWTNNITYKNWTLGLFFTYTFGRDVLDLYKANLFNTFSGWGGNAVSGLAQYALPALGSYNIWQQEGDQADYAKLDLGTYRYYYRQDQTFFLTKGDYVRLKSLSLSYNFPSSELQKIGIQKFRLFGVIDNLVRWQRSKDLPDAEAVNAYGEYDGNGYPIPKKFTAGLEINF
ncbi:MULTISPECIES: SusC/RagA family TonB-linked outer membrane protein [Chitinophagaceae]